MNEQALPETCAHGAFPAALPPELAALADSEALAALSPEDALAELRHLADTLAVVSGERRKAELELGILDGNDRFIQVIDDGSDEAVVQQFVTRLKLRSLHQLRLSERRPYFARLDFVPDGADTPVTQYLGRWGVFKTPEYKPWVVDWRSPMANLYYSGQVGHVEYEAPDGGVQGELTRKRMFTITDGRLEDVFDTGLLGQEKYLSDVLAQVTASRLREVVTTIQAEQNVVIRHDPFKPLIVQGVAGSGKTTIALHRVAWLLYRLQKTVAPHQMLILAPNPLFLTYISRVLPDLGVDEVRQTTFAQLCGLWLGKRMPKLPTQWQLEERLAMDKPGRDALDDRLRRKGELPIAALLDGYLDRLEQALPDIEPITFGGVTLMTPEEVREAYLGQLKHFPLLSRVEELQKLAASRMRRVADQLDARMSELFEQRLDALLRAMPDGPERRARAAKLVASRDERAGELKALRKAFPVTFMQRFQSLKLLDVYRAFWLDLAARDPGYAAARDATLPLLDKGQCAPEDLPLLVLLARRLVGLPRQDVKHVVVDEAQDMSPLAVYVLRLAMGHDAFTLVGDLMQGVHGDAGVRDWQALGAGVFEAQPTVATLSRSYRSTVEIMRLAFHVIGRHPVSDVALAEPTLRHGEAPRHTEIRTASERAEAIARVARGWLDEDFHSIAIVEKTEAQARKLHKALLPLLPQARILSAGQSDFEGGVLVMGASVVKGLEFDGVIVASAEDAVYPDDRFTAKLFYVLCTRPLHRLHLVHKGPLCAHAAGALD